MRQVISGLAAALALAGASAGPAMACGGLFDSCAPCGYVGPCGTAYVPASPWRLRWLRLVGV